MAVKKLVSKGHEVLAIGKTGGTIDGVAISKDTVDSSDVQTVTMYLNPLHQKAYYDYILSLKPERIIFNPGAENDELEQIATKAGIVTIEACTLVMLSTGQF